MVKAPALQFAWVDPILRPNQLELVSFPLNHLRPGLRADADPIEPWLGRKRTVGFDGHPESARTKRVDERLVELKHGFAAGDHNQPLLHSCAPERLDMPGKSIS